MSPQTKPPLIFDTNLLRARRIRNAPYYQNADFLNQRVTCDMIVTLSAVNRHFDMTLDLGGRNTGFAKSLVPLGLSNKFAHVIEADLDEETLNFDEDTLDLVVSNLCLHWVNDLPGVLAQIKRSLKPDGLFIGALFGGETLHQLRTCLIEAEIEVRGGYGPRIAPFAQGHDLIELMKRIGFAMPVVDVDKVVVSYDHPLKLMRELRHMGEGNIMIDRPRTGLNKAILARLCALYFERFSNAEGRIEASFEIITLSGWKPHESQQKPLKPGSAKMRLADALGVKEGRLD